MDLSVFENTREKKNHREEALELASAHWQPVRDSSLAAKIAQGVSGGERGLAEEKEELVGSFGTQSPLPVPRCTGKASFRGGPPGRFLLCHSVCGGGGRERRPSLVIKSFLCHKDRSQWPGCGAAG